MKLYRGRFRSVKTMKKALGMSGLTANHSGYYLHPVQTDPSGDRFVRMKNKAGMTVKHMLSRGGDR
jgi:hypothetical protein